MKEASISNPRKGIEAPPSSGAQAVFPVSSQLNTRPSDPATASPVPPVPTSSPMTTRPPVTTTSSPTNLPHQSSSSPVSLLHQVSSLPANHQPLPPSAPAPPIAPTPDSVINPNSHEPDFRISLSNYHVENNSS
ncbi:hypothetical protein Q3G72_006422 [Acer saccharum]|nr:hypothetical protein Q3G72_006422 [Acer saccharum]